LASEKNRCRALQQALDTSESELTQARAEAAEAKRRLGCIRPQSEYRKDVEQRLDWKGLKPGFWEAWRSANPPPFDYETCELAILDALTQEGISAWHGDASGCVTQIVQAQAKRAEAAEAERAEALIEIRKYGAWTELLPAIRHMVERLNGFEDALAPQAEKQL
jgi:hypothetical protein